MSSEFGRLLPSALAKALTSALLATTSALGDSAWADMHAPFVPTAFAPPKQSPDAIVARKLAHLHQDASWPRAPPQIRRFVQPPGEVCPQRSRLLGRKPTPSRANGPRSRAYVRIFLLKAVAQQSAPAPMASWDAMVISSSASRPGKAALV